MPTSDLLDPDATGVTFDQATRRVTGFNLDGTIPDAGFVEIQFEKNTAFFNQGKTRVGQSNLNVEGVVSFVEPIHSYELQNALEDLNNCCYLLGIVQDNNNKLRVLGVTYDSENDTYILEDMSTGDGSANTGADPTSDQNEYIETLSWNAGWYAPFFSGAVADIPLAP
jgi:hypothetical protein